MIYKNICVYKRESKIADLDMERYSLNPMVTINWDYSSPIGRAENLRWEGDDLVCDLCLQLNSDISMLFPMIAIAIGNRIKTAILLVISLSASKNRDSEIKCLGDQISSCSMLLINGKPFDYRSQKTKEMPDEEFYCRIGRYLRDVEK